MFIPVSPCTVTPDALEVLVHSSVAMYPGQCLRFDATHPAQGPVYWEIQHIILESGDTQRVRLRVLHGGPHAATRSATILEGAALYRTVETLLGEPTHPLLLHPGFTTDGARLGGLTVMEGVTLPRHRQQADDWLQGLAAHGPVWVVDPTGESLLDETSSTAAQRLKIGGDFRLSLQDVGAVGFLHAIQSAFPASLQEEALRVLAQHTPATPDFVPFLHYLHALRDDPSPLKATLLHVLFGVYQSGLFADAPEQVLALSPSPGVTVLDLSPLPSPWRTWCYGELCRQIRYSGTADLCLVFIEPGPVLFPLLGQPTSAHQLLLTAGRFPLEEGVANRFTFHGDTLRLCGELTAGFPLTFPLNPSPQGDPSPSPSPSSFADFPLPPLPAFQSRGFSTEPPSPAVPTPSAPALEPPTPDSPATPWEEAVGYSSIQEHALLQDEAFPTATTAPRAPAFPEIPAAAPAPEDVPFFFEPLGDSSPEPPSSPPPPEVEEAEDLAFHFDLGPMMEPLEDFSTPHSPAPEVLEPLVAAPPSPAPPLPPPPAVVLAEEAPDLDIPVYKTQAPALADYAAGQQVRHPKYGVGVINKVIPMDDNLVLNITFESVGKRLLDPALSPLEILSS